MVVTFLRALWRCVTRGFVLLAGFWASESLAAPLISGQVIRGSGLAHVLTCHNRARSQARVRLKLRSEDGEATAIYRLRLSPRRTSHVALSHTDQRLAEFRVIQLRSTNRRPLVCQHRVHLLADPDGELQPLPFRLSPTDLRELGMEERRGLPGESASNSSGGRDRVPSGSTEPSPCEQADLTQDAYVDAQDIEALFEAWLAEEMHADLTGDGLVDSADLRVLLGCWNPPPPTPTPLPENEGPGSQDPLPPAPIALPPHPIGMNAAGGITDWSVGHLFKNVLRSARRWEIVPSGWVSAAEEQHVVALRSQLILETDPNGYPLEVPFRSPLIRRCMNDQYSSDRRTCLSQSGEEIPLEVNTIFFTDHRYYPAGYYTLIAEGTGTVKFGLNAVGSEYRWQDIQLRGPKTVLTIPFRNEGSSALFYITRSERGDHVRNVKLLFPGETEQGEVSNPLYGPYLDGLRSMSVIRAWGEQYLPRRTPGERLEWNQRVLPTYYTQTTERGMAWEYRITAANELQQDLWITIPYHASDNYVRSLAQLIEQQLHPSLRVLVEYSNETWNYAGSFNLARAFCEEEGLRLGLAPEGTPTHLRGLIASHRYAALRTLQIGRIFAEELGSERAPVVLGSQAANAHLVSAVRLEALIAPDIRALVGAGTPAVSYLAIAPYFGNNTAQVMLNDPSVDIFSSPETMLVERILQHAESYLACETSRWIREQRQVLDNFNANHQLSIKLVAYEGGQHLVSAQFDSTDPAYQYQDRSYGQVADRLGTLFLYANRHPRMGELYRSLFKAWFEEGQGDLFMNFFYVEAPHITQGAWGMLDYLVDRDGRRQPLSLQTTPKMFAALEQIDTYITGAPRPGQILTCDN